MKTLSPATSSLFTLVALGCCSNSLVLAQQKYLRESAQRLRHFDNRDPSTFQVSGQNPEAAQLFAHMAEDPNNNTMDNIKDTAQQIEDQTKAQQEAFADFLESLARIGSKSMPDASEAPSVAPSASVMPSTGPTLAPTKAPSVTDTPTQAPVATPSTAPSVSVAPSTAPTEAAMIIVDLPTSLPSAAPTLPVDETVIEVPTAAPTTLPTARPTANPTTTPTDTPTLAPTTAAPTTLAPTGTPTVANCGISAQARRDGILALLTSVANPDDFLQSPPISPQALATEWILNQDAAVPCPDDPKFLQRWVLAVIYYSTGGDDWFRCSANPDATDACGEEFPFAADTRFLSAGTECDWAGISCLDDCVTEIEFEDNALIGTIPTEIGLLSDLAIWGMERGALSSTIPTEVGRLTNLIFLDLDFNQLTGSLPDEIYLLTDLTQLDVNDNQLTGNIHQIGVFTEMEFLQLHDNGFTGTVPPEVGNFAKLEVFTLHQTDISGVMPTEVCALFDPAFGILSTMIADCNGVEADIICDCCTDCRST